MAFSDFKEARTRKLCEAWGLALFPPAQCVGQIRPLCTIEGQSVLVGESRPDWRGGDQWMDRHFAKLTWVQTAKHWKLFWMPGSTMRWTSYEPAPVFARLEDALETIRKDAHACFLG